MRVLHKHLGRVGFLASLFVVASCSGGGCANCAGSTPIPGGFPREKAIENAGALRVTRPGLDFVAENLPQIATKLVTAPGGNLNFDIPKTVGGTVDLVITSAVPTICPDGPKENPPQCKAEVGIGKSKFTVDSVTPNKLVIRGQIPLKVEDTPVFLAINNFPDITVHVGYGDGACSAGKPQVTPHTLPVTISIPFTNETLSPRNGYTKLDVKNAEIDLSQLNKADVKICSDCGFASGLCSSITNSDTIKGFIVDPLKENLSGTIKTALEGQLCTKPNPAVNPPCPTGSKPDAQNLKCVYNSNGDQCVPSLLGMDARLDLSGLLRSISPGSVGGMDLVLASGGEMQAFPKSEPDNTPYAGHTPNGVTLQMVGGAQPLPISKCVPQVNLVVPSRIPLPDELTKDTLAPWPQGEKGPHVGLALAGRYLDYTFGALYNSGLFCLGVTTEQFPILNTGLVSVLVPSMKSLTFEQKAGAVAVSTRPQAPPTVIIGNGTDVKTDPLLLVNLPKFAVDFYVFSYDRFVRAFTFEGDLQLPINLQTGKDANNPNGGLLPVLGDLKVQNGKVTNSELLTDDPAKIASAMTTVLGAAVGQALGSGFSAIDYSAPLKSFGLGLTIPAGGVRKLRKDNDDFLGLFANLSVETGAGMPEAQASIRVLGKTVHKEAMTLATHDEAKNPEIRVAFASALDGAGKEVEFSYALDNGTRSAWGKDREIVIKDDILFLQGRHTIRAYARLVDLPSTESTVPGTAEVVIDALPPQVLLERDNGSFSVQASDVVSPKSALRGRYRLGDKAFGDWVPLADLQRVGIDSDAAAAGGDIFVEISDEEGNVAQISQPLIRGRADASLAPAGGCGCKTAGESGTKGAALPATLLGLGALAALALRRRQKQSHKPGHSGAALVALSSVVMVAATSQGCACGSDDSATTGCGADCNTECKDPLPVGLAGAYTSAAKAGDGSVWVAGYNDAVLTSDFSTLYGDLVVGKFDVGTQQVNWETVDGLPAARSDGTCADHDPKGWRRGETEAGDNVGLWTSLQIGKDNRPMIAYYDATNRALKYAIKVENGWKSYVLKGGAESDIGRYAKMLVVDDKPIVAFAWFEPGKDGKARAKVALARANDAAPMDETAWRFEDVAVVEDAPCRGITCKGSDVCVKATGTCSKAVTGCAPACSSGNACVTIDGKATCSPILGRDTPEAYFNAFGGYIGLARGPSGLGLVTYDRVNGNLIAIAQAGGGWKQTILDGETGSRKDKTAIDTGDTGVGASLVIAEDGSFHVTYVSGLDETLRYVTMKDSTPGKSEIIDDGASVDGKPNADGKHVVGDDSMVSIESAGAIRVFYQDATQGTLRMATGTVQGGARVWDLKTLPQPGKFAGFFPRLVDGKVANFWRQTDPVTKDISGNVSLVSP
jgi:MYXO-CTERM domain-containing protein